jgi:hypothetical protein
VKDVDVSAERVLTGALAAIRQAGDVMEDPDAIEAPTIMGIVKVGHFDMNPAIVRVSAVPLEANRTRFLVSAISKEGLIKQGTAKKAADRVQGLVLSELAL